MEEFPDEGVIRFGRPEPTTSHHSTVNSPKGTSLNALSPGPLRSCSIPVRKVEGREDGEGQRLNGLSPFPWRSGSTPPGEVEGGEDGEVEGDADDEMIPPHVIVERRFAAGSDRIAAFSMCTGNGRTLKGSDLRNVRDSVLKQTGFLEGKD